MHKTWIKDIQAYSKTNEEFPFPLLSDESGEFVLRVGIIDTKDSGSDATLDVRELLTKRAQLRKMRQQRGKQSSSSLLLHNSEEDCWWNTSSSSSSTFTSIFSKMFNLEEMFKSYLTISDGNETDANSSSERKLQEDSLAEQRQAYPPLKGWPSEEKKEIEKQARNLSDNSEQGENIDCNSSPTEKNQGQESVGLHAIDKRGNNNRRSKDEDGEKEKRCQRR